MHELRVDRRAGPLNVIASTEMMLLALAIFISGFLLLALIELARPHANLIFGAAVAEGKVVSSGMESSGHGDRRRFRPQITYEFGKENCI